MREGSQQHVEHDSIGMLRPHRLESGQAMLDMMNGMLDLSRGDQVQLSAEVRRIRLLPWLAGVLAEREPVAARRGRRLRLTCAEEVQMVADPVLLQRVMLNLVDNAIKFQNTSDRAESFVLIRVDRIPEGIRIKVIDNGIGIDRMSAEKIFQMFVRASERSETGGLGLYLSRIAVEKLGGDISLHITEEKWTEFRVILPADLNVIMEERRQAELRADD